MQFRNKMEVLDAHGRSIGSIDRVVLDPRTREVTHLVAKKGIFFTREKVIPIARVEQANERQVILKDISDADELVDFEEASYIPVDSASASAEEPQDNARSLMWYPRLGIPDWGMGFYPPYGAPNFFLRTRRNIPEGSVALAEGADVLCRDGRKAGKVERIFTEPRQERATHIVISEGLLRKERKLIPTIWVDTVREDTLRLGVDCDVVDRLPPYTPDKNA